MCYQVKESINFLNKFTVSIINIFKTLVPWTIKSSQRFFLSLRWIDFQSTEFRLFMRTSFDCEDFSREIFLFTQFLLRKLATMWSKMVRPLQFTIFGTSINCLTILTGKNLCFTEFSTKIHWKIRLAASDVFHYLYTIN